MAKNILSEGLLILVISFGISNALEIGPCPVVKPQVDFELANATGKWYEYAKYPIPVEFSSKCGVVRVKEVDEQYSIVRTIIGKLSQVQIGLSGSIVQVNEGVLQIKPDLSLKGPYNVSILGSDYENYLVAYVCQDIFGIVHHENAFVLAREQHPSAEVAKEAKIALNSNGLSDLKLVQSQQIGCPITN